MMCGVLNASASSFEKKQESSNKKIASYFGSDISRIQYRRSDMDTNGITLSTFVSLKNQTFVLTAYNNESNRRGQGNKHNELFETNVGVPLFKEDNKTLLYGIARIQKIPSHAEVYTVGVQFNISDLAPIRSFMKNRKITTFIQILPLKNETNIGGAEIIHYYNIPLYKTIQARGYNQFIQRNGEKYFYNLWVDVIYPINKRADLYLRINHRSDLNAIYGIQGNEFWIGFRLNHSFLN